MRDLSCVEARYEVLVRGELRLEYGPGVRDSVTVSADDCFMVPPQTVHREGNVTERSGEVVLVRIGEGPAVFAVDGSEPH